MPEKDIANAIYEWSKNSLPFFTTMFLSCWGGLVNYIQKIRKNSKKFSWRELIFDLVTSSFAGLLTQYFCEYSNISPTASAMLIAISGHMGARAIASFEKVRDRILGVDSNG